MATSLHPVDPVKSVHPALWRLTTLRTLARAMLTAQTAGWLLAVLCATLVALGLMDYFLRSPSWLRGGLLGAVVAGAIWVFLTRVVPALRFSPTLTEFALRLERTAGGKAAGLTNLLASAIDLTSTGQAHAAPGVIEEAGRRVRQMKLSDVVRPDRTVAAVGAFAAVVVAIIALFASQPALSWTGARRVLTPWGAADWPKRTQIEDVTKLTVHPLGSSLPLRAALVASERTAAATRIEAAFRLIDSRGVAGPVRRVVLTSQDRAVLVMVADPAAGTDARREHNAALFERLIEPAGLTQSEAAATDAKADPGQVEYWLESEDDQTPARRVTLVRPPAVTTAVAAVTPPAYLRNTDAGTARRVEMGAGIDERSTVPGVLIGSVMRIEIMLNKPVPPAPASAADREAWITRTLGSELARAAREDGATIETGAADGAGRSASWTLGWTVSRSVRLPIRLLDQHGIPSDSECVFRIDAREDRAPDATVTKPSEDTEVLATAAVDTTSEARDDVGLKSVTAEYRLARRPGGSQGAAPEPVSESYETVAAASAPPAGPDGKQPLTKLLTTSSTLDLSMIGVKAGEELWLTALATDNYELNGAVHAPVRSTVRKLRVISNEQFVEQIWNELASVRRSAIGLAEQQQKNRDNVREGRDGPAAARDQAGITEGASRQEQAVEKLAERATTNRLEDADIKGMLDDAKAMLDKAKSESAAASQGLKDSAESKAQGQSAKSAEQSAAAQAKQKSAQDSLERLAEALDKGQDAWSTRRGLERLLQDQKDLREQAAQTAAKTTGKAESELTQGERQQIEEQAQRQDELARRADEAIRKMQDKAEQLKENNPTTAGALSEAAAKGQRQELQKKMEQSAQNMRQNRQQNARKQQDEAVKTMEEMMQEMDNASRNRDEVLARELQSIIESLEAIIKRQTAEIAALTVAMEAKSYGGRDEAQIKIRSATLGVAEQAKAAGREARETAELVGAAATAMADAVTRLRATPVNAEEAVTSEQEALSKLREAKAKAEEAKKAAQDREMRRKKAELKKAYRELLDEQTNLRQQTVDVEKIEAGRKQRAAARELSAPQDEIRRKASDLVARTTALSESEIFKFAHKRLDEATGGAAQRLGEGEVGQRVASRQNSAIRIIQSILDSLDEKQPKDDDFREQQDAGAQQGGQQAAPKLIPDAAELKMLRQLQIEANALTREAEGVDGAERAEALTDAGVMQQEIFKRAEELLKKLMQKPGSSIEPDEPAAAPGDPQ